VAWEVTHGPIPDGLSVLHHCDNPACCNPTIDAEPPHLFLGTQADNIADMRSKKRGYNGPFAKLSADDIREIRRLSGKGATQPELAARFGVHRGHIGRIVRNEIWRHV
jgi:hypothetical protein